LIEKAKNAGFFGRKKAEAQAKDAEAMLRKLKEESKSGAESFFYNLHNETVRISQDLNYEKSSTGSGVGFSEANFSNVFSGYGLEQWIKLSEQNPSTAFGGLKDKMIDLDRRAKIIKERRPVIDRQLLTLRQDLLTKNQQLKDRVEEVFKG